MYARASRVRTEVRVSYAFVHTAQCSFVIRRLSIRPARVYATLSRAQHYHIPSGPSVVSYVCAPANVKHRVVRSEAALSTKRPREPGGSPAEALDRLIRSTGSSWGTSDLSSFRISRVFVEISIVVRFFIKHDRILFTRLRVSFVPRSVVYFYEWFPPRRTHRQLSGVANLTHLFGGGGRGDF